MMGWHWCRARDVWVKKWPSHPSMSTTTWTTDKLHKHVDAILQQSSVVTLRYRIAELVMVLMCLVLLQQTPSGCAVQSINQVAANWTWDAPRCVLERNQARSQRQLSNVPAELYSSMFLNKCFSFDFSIVKTSNPTTTCAIRSLPLLKII